MVDGIVCGDRGIEHSERCEIIKEEKAFLETNVSARRRRTHHHGEEEGIEEGKGGEEDEGTEEDKGGEEEE